VAKGFNSTLAIAGGLLYYMGTKGVYAYTGSGARLVSRWVIDENADAITATGDDRYYYLAVKKEDSEYIFTYDTHYGIWHKTTCDNSVKALVKCPDGIYAICDNCVKIIGNETPGEWYFAFELGTKEFASKHLCSLYLRYSLGENAEFNLYAENDKGSYHLKNANIKADNEVLRLRIPVSCAYDAKIVFKGKGEFVLNSLEPGYRETGIYDN